MNPQFILIYCSENQAVANKFAGDLTSSGASFVHIEADKAADLTQVISSTKPAILLVTDNFLRNKVCLNHAYANYAQIIKSGRLMVIVADGYSKNGNGEIVTVKTQIERVSNIIQYMNYWQDLYLEERKKLSSGLTSEAEVNVIKAISAEVGDFIRNIKESNFQNYENLTARNYQQFCQMAGLPMPTVNLPIAKEETIHVSQVIENEAFINTETILETPIVESLPEAEQPREAIEIPTTPSEDETIDAILDNIPGIDLLPKNPIRETATAAKEIDEDDFFNETPPIPSDSNINEIMDEVVAEEERDGNEMEEIPNGDIEDIFSEEQGETEEIDYLFQNITNNKSDVVENIPSEVSIAPATAPNESEMLDNQGIVNLERTIDPEEELLDSLNEETEFSLGEATSAVTESTKNEEIIEVETPKEERKTEVKTSASLTTKERLKLALDFAKQQNFKSATAELEEVLAENPNNADAYFLMAEVSELNKDFISALSFYEKVADISPYYPGVFNKLGLLSAVSFPNERKQTKKYFKKAIDLDEDNADLLYAYAEFLNEDDSNQDKAIKYFKRVLKINEHHAFANYDLAVIYHRAGEHSLANEYYVTACGNNPELATPENDNAFTSYHVLDVERAGEAINLHNFEVEGQLQPIENEVVVGNSIAVVENPVTIGEEEKSIVEPVIIQAPKVNKYKPQGDEKIVLITGATAGIGRATAELFAKNGYNLILSGRREDRLIALQNEFHEKYSGGCIILNFDVRNLSQIQVTFDNLDKDWKSIDILVNNAGLALGMDPIHEGNMEQWDTMIDTNVKGLLYMTRLISPLMVARQTGHIINLCSTAGKEVYPNGNVYCATKFAVDSLTRSTRIDLHKFGIRVGQISPGAVEETEFSEVRFNGNKDRAAKIYEGFQPLLASDVADTIYYMASAPSHVNIQDILIMGTQQASATIIDRSGR